MPELPEVEIFKQFFHQHAVGRTVARVRVNDERILGDTTTAELRKRLRGQSFQQTHRHGKHLFAQLSEDCWLRIHFGMTGDLYFNDISAEGDRNPPRFARVTFDTTDGNRLTFDDPRIFGRVDLTTSPQEYVRERGLGPDPLAAGFTLRTFRALLRGRKGAIKALLLTQEVIAGVGNLYADEALFQAGIDPRRSVAKLQESEVSALHRKLQAILKESIRRHLRGSPVPRTYLLHQREAGADCPRCEVEIRQTIVFGRTTFYCPQHQR